MVGRPMVSMTHDEGDRVLLRLSTRDYFLPACTVTVYTDVVSRHTSRCAAYNSLPSVLSPTTFTAATPFVAPGTQVSADVGTSASTPFSSRKGCVPQPRNQHLCQLLSVHCRVH
jgi:hypothetical protein